MATSTEGNDVLRGTPQADDLQGSAGDDKIYGGDGNDGLRGGAGTDELYGEAGDDYLDGGAGDDVLYGGDGADYLEDGRGADKLYGGDGDDQIRLSLFGGGRAVADGGSGNDFITSSNGGSGANQAVTLIGGDGDDRILLNGFARGNIIDAGSGNDTVELGSALDAIITLGTGADKLELLPTILLSGSDEFVVTDFQPGVDQLNSGLDRAYKNYFIGWDTNTNPFATGFVSLMADGSDTLLQFDPNGGGDQYKTIIRFKGLSPSAFTAADFNGFPPDGSNAVPMQPNTAPLLIVVEK